MEVLIWYIAKGGEGGKEEREKIDGVWGDRKRGIEIEQQAGGGGVLFGGWVNSKDVQNSFEGWSACNDDVCSIEKLKKVHFSGGVGWGDRTVLAIRPPLRKRGKGKKRLQ